MNEERDKSEHQHVQLNAELRQLAVDLSRLRPRNDRLDRERLAFLAGQASIVSKANRTTKLFGLPVEFRAWPAAFAAMTTIAASLAITLLIRPQNSRLGSSTAIESGDQAAAKFAVEHPGNSGVLSTRDAHFPDIELRLAQRQINQIKSDAPEAKTSEKKQPILTPATWDQAINGTQPTRPSPNDASRFLPNKGARS